MELNKEISTHVTGKYEEWLSSAALNDFQKEEIALIVSMAYSDGKSKGKREGSIMSNKIGPYLNR